MYNDSWPVSHGWTIVDYYRRKKLAYHPVRRAFQPIAVVVTCDDAHVTVYGVNDTPQLWSGELRYGLFTLAGRLARDERVHVKLPANASTPLARFSRADWEKLDFCKSGAFALLYQNGRPLAQHRLFLKRFKDLAFVEPHITMTVENGVLTAVSDAFAWAVCLDVDGEAPLADNCFDLIPGIPYETAWNSTLGKPQVVRLGNRDAVQPTSP
jgi:beta-mannosidase